MSAPQHSNEIPIKVVLPGEDPANVTFDEAGTPLLEFVESNEHGMPGWRLSYVDATDGVEDHFIPGQLDDLGWVSTQARGHLQAIGWPLRSGGED
ncbi:hypothetical protein [Streptomyces sp. NBC_01235]|uniref:hypothetical protein n=1 Tax=Streptomyces sp. NBC_01235 TaxID=2903788 RepID=UPI002E0F0D15|nr:hypothetical protein OG289_42180 [Streptomyces sp. NBC_01235]